MLINEFKNQRLSKGSLIAFNVQNFTHIHSLYRCIRDLKKSAIAQFSARYIPYWDERVGIPHLVKKYQKNGLYFFLDHCKDVKIIKQCIDANFAGVMFDGSSFEIDENIRITNEIYDYIVKNNKKTILEVELGEIVGVEDGFEGAKETEYFSMAELDKMVNKGSFDLLALGIGNAHGLYGTTYNVKPELLKKASDKYPDLLLVLHGSTGLPEKMILESISHGVVKINVSTELKLVTQNVLKQFVKSSDFYNEINWFQHAEKEMSDMYMLAIKKYTN